VAWASCPCKNKSKFLWHGHLAPAKINPNSCGMGISSHPIKPALIVKISTINNLVLLKKPGFLIRDKKLKNTT
jgi:hypothetical protein